MALLPLSKDEQRLMVAFFKANFDPANYWDAYCERLRETRFLAKTLDELDADGEIKLAIRLKCLNPFWVTELKQNLHRIAGELLEQMEREQRRKKRK